MRFLYNLDILKDYMNEHHNKYHCDKIISARIITRRYDLSQVSEQSSYYDTAKKNGFIELITIQPIWNGWFLNGPEHIASIHRDSYHNNWYHYKENRKNHFNLDSFQEWFINKRSEKINIILNINESISV